MKKQAGSIEPSELREVAGLVKQAASAIEQMSVLNQSMEEAAAAAVTHYRSQTKFLVAGAKALQSDSASLVVSLTAKVEELETLVQIQRKEISALREMLALATADRRAD